MYTDTLSDMLEEYTGRDFSNKKAGELQFALEDLFRVIPV